METIHKAHDPAIFFSIFLRRSVPEEQVDQRAGILKQFDGFADRYHLEPSAELRYRRAMDIDLVGLGKSSPDFRILIRCQSEYPKSLTGTYYECLAYAYEDALILQITITKFADWKGTLTGGWDEVTQLLRAGFDGKALDDAPNESLGVSALYWGFADHNSRPETYMNEISLIAEGKGLRQTATDFGGPLWLCDRALFANAPTLPQKLWLLVTPRSAEETVNKRFNQPGLDAPSDFYIVSLALHKIDYERADYHKERERMELTSKSLESHVKEIVDLQRNLGPELDELRSSHGISVQRKLARAMAEVADYRHSIGLLKELRRTLVINRSNFLINSIALISSDDALRVINSIDQETAASTVRANWHRDEIFGREVGRVQGMCRQLDSDIDYAASRAERLAGSLRSVSDQLQIAGQRELGEIAHHLSINSAAVVASVVAVIVVEGILKDQLSEGDPLFWAAAGFLVVGSFAATQVLSSGCRGKRLERGSVAATVGFFGALFGIWGLRHAAHIDFAGVHRVAKLIPANHAHWVSWSAGLVTGLLFGYGALKGYQWLQNRLRTAQKGN